jgi:hypothetical protein
VNRAPASLASPCSTNAITTAASNQLFSLLAARRCSSFVRLCVTAVHSVTSGRVVSIALGYEDLHNHAELRHDPVLAPLGGKLTARRSDCAPLADKSTLLCGGCRG